MAKQTWYQPFLSSKDQSSWDPGWTKIAGTTAATEAVAVAAVATTGTAGIVAAAAEVVADVAAAVAAADVGAAVAAASKPAACPKCYPLGQAYIVLVMLVVALLSQRFPS